MILEESNLVQFLLVYAQNTLNFVFKILEMIKKIKADVDRLLSVFVMKIIFPIDFVKIELFFIFETRKWLIY